MADVALLWLQYALVSAAIVYAGSQVAKHVDRIADVTRLSRAWLGLTALAAVTSLPELVTGISAVSFFDAPDIAVGDVFGSCVFNLLIVVLLDALVSGGSLFQSASSNLIRPALWSFALVAAAGIGLYLGASLPSIAGVGVVSFVILGLYALAMISTRTRGSTENPNEGPNPPLRTLWLRFARDASIVVAAATYLPYLGTQLANATGLATTFIGNFLIAASTSLPELVTAVAALKQGTPDLALGDLIGSNLFDIAILAIDDAFYRPGPLFAEASLRHGYSVVAALLMTATIILGLRRRAGKTFGLAPESFVLIAIYASALAGFLLN